MAEFGAVELLGKSHFGVFAEDVNEFFDGDIAVVEFCGGDVGEDISVGAAGQFKAQFGVGGGYVVIEIDGQFEFGEAEMVVGFVVDAPFELEFGLELEHVFAVVISGLVSAIIGAVVQGERLIFVVSVLGQLGIGLFGVGAQDEEVGLFGVCFFYRARLLKGHDGFEVGDSPNHGFGLIFCGDGIE